MVQNYEREIHGGKSGKRVSHGGTCTPGCKAKDPVQPPLVEARQPALPGANREHVGAEASQIGPLRTVKSSFSGSW
jgi:hypothetical protein